MSDRLHDPRVRLAGYSSAVYVRQGLEAPIELTVGGVRHSMAPRRRILDQLQGRDISGAIKDSVKDLVD